MENVLDASALLALVLREPGQEQVRKALAAGSYLCTVNMAEVATRCALVGMPNAVIRGLAGLFPVELVDADLDLALRAAEMTPITKPFGLSLGDRFCLALAAREGLPVVTADRAWNEIATALGVQVWLIRPVASSAQPRR